MTCTVINIQITKPCIPCRYPCDELVCSEACLDGETRLVSFTLSHLSLVPWVKPPDDNETRLQPYFITVKALTGSGLAAVASSRGIYIDTTPPDVHLMYHVDPSWSSLEPTRFQGVTTTIAVYFEVTDEESEVMASVC